MSENSRELRLARRALRAARTHLSLSLGTISMSEPTRVDVLDLLRAVQSLIPLVSAAAVKADAHLEAMVRSRRK